MVTRPTSKLLPTSYELIGLGLLSFLLMFLGNTRQLLSYYGLTSSNQVITNSAGSALSRGLATLDTFSLTKQVVTFLIWSVIGLLCFSLVRAVAGVVHELNYDGAVSSNRFIHPSTFKRGIFWRRLLRDFVLLVVSLILLAVVTYGFFVLALPTALAYGRDFLFATSLSSVLNFVIGLVLVYVSLVALAITVRFVLFHSHLTRGRVLKGVA